METTNLTLSILLFMAVLAGLYWFSRAKDLATQLVDSEEEFETAMNHLNTTKNQTYDLQRQLDLYQKIHMVKPNNIKINVHGEIAAAIVKISEAYEKLNKIEIYVENKELVGLIEEMANDLTRTNYHCELGYITSQNVINDGAVVGAYVLNFLVNYKEVAA